MRLPVLWLLTLPPLLGGASAAVPAYDCNGNGVEDAADIAEGLSEDQNWNGIPDECEPREPGPCPCPVGRALCVGGRRPRPRPAS